MPDESMRILEAAQWPWRAAFAIGAMLGLRCGEILGLRWMDINFSQRIVHVRQNAVNGIIQTVKSKNSKADLPMPESLESFLREYESHLDDTDDGHSTSLLFHKDHRPLQGERLRKELSAVLKAEGIKHGAMHAFRHGLVTLLLNQGVPIHTVKAIARHGRIETTARYSHAQAESLRDAINTGKHGFSRGNNGVTAMQKTKGDLQ